MSGGVDSSVAAALLLEQGYDVHGLFMKNWEEDDDAEYCAAAEDLNDAEQVCRTLSVELSTVNFSHEYWERVFQQSLDEHRAGRTPNPDVLCNKEIKFKEFLEHAEKLGAQYIATGHYARIAKVDDQFRLLKGVDTDKDQTYFLYTLQQNVLSRTLFPLGDLNKSEVRQRAQELGFANFDKKDSTGICFIGERKFKTFLSQYLPAQPGEIRDLDEEVVGKHDGLMYYTIGQRHGLGIGGEGEAWYVARKDLAHNLLYVVQGHDHPVLFSQYVFVHDLHWVNGNPPSTEFKCRAKSRYRQADQECTVEILNNNQTFVSFDREQRAVTPGQSMVFYDGDVCLGGGVIERAEAERSLSAA
jgi:tRNA-specific 2-thiouridylase